MSVVGMRLKDILHRAVWVSALGYFVDIYDLLLFSIVRMVSLKELGVPDEHLLAEGVFLINAQMIGLLLGGIGWGILGDKRGRISVLFGSIFLYSIANIANAFVHSVESYAILRFLAGVGLAGELGAAITLVCEVSKKEARGYGTAIVAGIGILGAIFAAFIGAHFHWRTAYALGGVMGLCLLLLRFRMNESGIFEKLKSVDPALRGDIRVLFRSWRSASRYIHCIIIGIPIWYVVGILITFSPELSTELNVEGGPAVAGWAVSCCYAGLSLGDFVSGFLSQYFQSRRKVLLAFMFATSIFILLYLKGPVLTLTGFYILCAFLGFATGFWAVFVTVASEHFGTNLRATVTTTAPNFVRGAVVPMTTAFQLLSLRVSRTDAALLVGIVVMGLAILSAISLEETHGRDLDYLEHL